MMDLSEAAGSSPPYITQEVILGLACQCLLVTIGHHPYNMNFVIVMFSHSHQSAGAYMWLQRCYPGGLLGQ